MILLQDGTMFFDNSSLKDWREKGPRYWYFRHYRKWIKQTLPSEALTVPAWQAGNAWHAMMDVYWTEPSLGWEPAWECYKRYWYEHSLAGGFPIDDLDPDFEMSLEPYSPRTMEMTLIAYDELRRPLLEGIELIRAERPFIVAIDPNDNKLFYTGRKDKVFRHQNRLIMADHKTTSLFYVKPLGYPHLRPYWKAQWRVSTQPRGYLFALKQEFELTRTSIWIDGVLFNKDDRANRFCLEPVDCNDAALDAWNWMTLNTIHEIRRHIETVENMRAQGTADHHAYLPAFPCYGCSGGCPYADLCMQKDNPEAWLHGEEIPDGYIENEWAPFRVEELTKILEGGGEET